MTRYSDYLVNDPCFSPRYIVNQYNGDELRIICGKCPACRVAYSNRWANRLSSEIKNCAYPIFFTLTYDNVHVPRMVAIDDCFVPINRDDDIIIDYDEIGLTDTDYIPSICHYKSDKLEFAYLSKRDIQLFLKRLRKKINKYFPNEKIRYYIIGEYGPKTYRPHFHGILFVSSYSLAYKLLPSATSVSWLYSCWKMCSKDRFEKYVSIVQPFGVSEYVSSYTTCNTRLPKILQHKSISKVRLSSKAPSIGYMCYDRKEVFEKIDKGIVTTLKYDERHKTYTQLLYPSDYINSLLCKCKGYSSMSFGQRLSTVSICYNEVKSGKTTFSLACKRLRSTTDPLTYRSNLLCYRFCEEFSKTPYDYVSLIDKYLYFRSQFNLKCFYETQQSLISCGDLRGVTYQYVNCTELLLKYNLQSPPLKKYLDFFFNCLDMSPKDPYTDILLSNEHYSKDYISYSLQMINIYKNLDKSKKVNDLFNESTYGGEISYRPLSF